MVSITDNYTREDLDELCGILGTEGTGFNFYVMINCVTKPRTGYLKYLRNFRLNGESGGASGVYASVLFMLELDFEDLPLYVNTEEVFCGTVCKWRLEKGF